MDAQSSPEFLRQLAARLGVDPSDDDLEAVRSFLGAILPRLEELEATLEPEDA